MSKVHLFFVGVTSFYSTLCYCWLPLTSFVFAVQFCWQVNIIAPVIQIHLLLSKSSHRQQISTATANPAIAFRCPVFISDAQNPIIANVAGILSARIAIMKTTTMTQSATKASTNVPSPLR